LNTLAYISYSLTAVLCSSWHIHLPVFPLPFSIFTLECDSLFDPFAWRSLFPCGWPDVHNNTTPPALNPSFSLLCTGMTPVLFSRIPAKWIVSTNARPVQRYGNTLGSILIQTTGLGIPVNSTCILPQFIVANTATNHWPHYKRFYHPCYSPAYRNHLNCTTLQVRRGAGSSVSIVSDYGLDDRAIEVRSPSEAKDFSSNLCVQTGSGAYPVSCTMGTGVFQRGKVQPGRDADHSPHPVPRSRMSRSYNSYYGV
jgi:hypothetical protein